ncbi:MAG: hypothetical protein RL071_4746 [Pseudomonadota bacterium]
MTRRFSGRVEALIALLLAVLSAACALRGATAPGLLLVGDPGHPDTLANHWLLDWTAHRLRSGQQLWFNADYYWPVGDQPVLAGNGADGLLAAPLLALWPWPAGALAYAALQRILDGLAGWALGRALGLRGAPALLLVPALCLSPSALVEASAGRWTQAGTWPLTLCLAAGLRLCRRPTAGGALGLGLALALTGGVYWYYAWFALLALGLIGLLAAPGRRAWAAGALGVWGGLLVLSPWLWAFLRSWAQIPGVDEAPGVGGQRLREALAGAGQLLIAAPGPARAACLSAPLLLLGAAGAGVGPRRQVRALIGVGVVFLALGTGDWGPASPFALLYDRLPLLRRFWWPLRHFVVVHVMIAALAGLGLAALGRRAAGGRALIGAAALAAIPIGTALQGAPDRVELHPIPWPQAAWAELAGWGPGAVVQPPLSPEAAGSSWPLMAQRAHGHPTVAGHAPWVARGRPAAWDAWAARQPAISALQALERGDPITLRGAELRALAAAGAPHFALDRAALPVELQGVVRALNDGLRAVCGRPKWRDQGVALWDLRACDPAAEVALHSPWPAGLRPAGPELPLQGRWPAR